MITIFMLNQFSLFWTFLFLTLCVFLGYMQTFTYWCLVIFRSIFNGWIFHFFKVWIVTRVIFLSDSKVMTIATWHLGMWMCKTRVTMWAHWHIFFRFIDLCWSFLNWLRIQSFLFKVYFFRNSWHVLSFSNIWLI